MTHPSRFRAPSSPIESTALIWAGMATRDCYLATSVDQPGDVVVHQVRSRGRKAPAKRQVESSLARKTHRASTGLALGLISDFGTKLMCLRVHACRLMRAKRTRSMTPDYEYGRREFESLRARHSRSLLSTAVTLRSIKLQIVSFGPVTLSRIATGGSPVLRCNCDNIALKRFGGGVLWCSNLL
jgi:hypothetical protein